MKFIKIYKEKIILLVVMTILGVALVFLESNMGVYSPANISVVNVNKNSLTPAVFGIGVVEGRRNWSVAPREDGRVLRIHVDVGSTVKAGQLLVEMDSENIDRQLKVQEDALSNAIRSLDKARIQHADSDVRYKLAKEQMGLHEELVKLNFIHRNALIGLEKELELSATLLHMAQDNVNEAEKKMRTISEQRNTVAKRKQNMLLYAPADALVISRDAEIGELVNAGQSVIGLSNPADRWVKLSVDPTRSIGLEVGLAAQIVSQQLHPQKQMKLTLTGNVESVDSLANGETGEIIAWVKLQPTTQPSLSSGDKVEVLLKTKPINNSLVVPVDAMHVHYGNSGVWLLNKDSLQFTIVKWGAFSLDGHVQVLDGLTLGDTVVIRTDKPLSINARFKVI